MIAGVFNNKKFGEILWINCSEFKNNFVPQSVVQFIHFSATRNPPLRITPKRFLQPPPHPLLLSVKSPLLLVHNSYFRLLFFIGWATLTTFCFASPQVLLRSTTSSFLSSLPITTWCLHLSNNLSSSMSCNGRCVNCSSEDALFRSNIAQYFTW